MEYRTLNSNRSSLYQKSSYFHSCLVAMNIQSRKVLNSFRTIIYILREMNLFLWRTGNQYQRSEMKNLNFFPVLHIIFTQVYVVKVCIFFTKLKVWSSKLRFRWAINFWVYLIKILYFCGDLVMNFLNHLK